MRPWPIALVLGVTTFVHYLDRNTLALALPHIAAENHWTEAETGYWGQYLLGAFYLTFGLFQIFLSTAAERWNIKAALILSIVGFSTATMLFYPFGRNLLALIGLRLLLGAAESLHMPMNSAIVARTFPPEARSRANALYVGGILLALLLGPVLLVPLIDQVGWRLTFAILGLGGLLLSLPLVWRFIPPLPPAPKNHPWPPSHRDPTLNLYMLAGSANAFCVFGLLNWLPSYLTWSQGLPFDALSGPLVSVFAGSLVGLAWWAWLGDRTGKRLTLAAAGLAVAGLCVMLIALPLSPTAIVAVLTLGTFFQSSYNAQEFATLQTLYPPQQSGAITGKYNGLTVLLGGVGGSFIPGTLVAYTGSFQAGLLSIAAGAFLVACTLLYLRYRLRRQGRLL